MPLQIVQRSDREKHPVFQALESRCKALGVYPALLPAAAYEVAGIACYRGAQQRHAGRLDDARQTWRELKEINPGYSPRDHIGRLPFKDPAHADRFIDGLRKAGLAE